MAKVTVEAAGLAHPEGPTRLPDGGIAFVETRRERVSVWRRGEGVVSFSDCGGAPNACAGGHDGVYVTQMGDGFGGWRPVRRMQPSIQKIAWDGTVSVVAAVVDGRPLAAPNDLCFGPAGNLLFTDPDAFDPANARHGFIVSIKPDGSTDFVLDVGPTFPNGIVALADGSAVWVESYTRRVRRRLANGAIADIATLPDGHMPDGLKAGADGCLYIASIMSGGIDVVPGDGSPGRFIETGGQPLNCLFDGEDLLIADEGEPGAIPPVGASADTGRLLRLRLGVAGAPIYRGAIADREARP
jgi:gluconolactonase